MWYISDITGDIKWYIFRCFNKSGGGKFNDVFVRFPARQVPPGKGYI